jgi:hypothetical protein
MFILTHGFQRFQSVVTWPLCLWACGEAAHHGRVCAMKQLAHFMVTRKQKGRRGPIQGHESSGLTFFP